jgi:ferredoxin
MSSTFLWAGDPVVFRGGETYAAALRRAGVDDLGPSTGQLRARYFCGVGACQACLVSVDGASPVEACLTPAKAGAHLSAAMPFLQEPHHG